MRATFIEIDGKLAIRFDPEIDEERLLLKAFDKQIGGSQGVLRVNGWATDSWDGDDAFVIVKQQRRISPANVTHFRKNEILTAAEELRTASRLTPQQLAQVFGVSRTTFYNWMEGATPREEAFTHLVEALNHIKDAKKKLDGIIDLPTWLRTPIAAGGKSPLQYIKEQQFSVFRGLVVRAGSPMSGFSQVKAPMVQPSMSVFERRLARERLSPSAQFEDDDESVK
ncbi:MAG TPA: helix-turn-helix transcriptional regulator [Gemmatimonadaceae bacterium]|nr:helix-turn-helix transcriptional regulator [Gemmatimonadaceae bacterium]